ncbi:hypothetical protein D3C79_904080 [compost metagenome]
MHIGEQCNAAGIIQLIEQIHIELGQIAVRRIHLSCRYHTSSSHGILAPLGYEVFDERLGFRLHHRRFGDEQANPRTANPAVNIAFAASDGREFEEADLVLEILRNIRVGREIRQLPGSRQV